MKIKRRKENKKTVILSLTGNLFLLKKFKRTILGRKEVKL